MTQNHEDVCLGVTVEFEHKGHQVRLEGFEFHFDMYVDGKLTDQLEYPKMVSPIKGEDSGAIELAKEIIDEDDSRLTTR